MARLTSTALRNPRANKSTPMTSSRPVMILFSRSASIRRTSLALSISLVIWVPRGQVDSWRSINWSILSVMAMMFSPTRFLTVMLTASRPFRRERLFSSSNPSTTRAMSFR